MVHLEILEAELLKRQSKNKSYSVRAFCRDLQIDPSYLSKVLNKEAALSLKSANKIALKLELDEEARKIFLLATADDQKCWALYQLDPTLTDCE